MFRKFGLMAIIVIIMGIIISCGEKKEETKPQTEKKTEGTEITLMVPDWGVPTEAMLEDFKKESGITVKVLPTSWDDIKSKVAVAAAGKKAVADIIEVDWSWVGEFVSAGWLEELNPSEELIKDIPSISSFEVNKKIYAIPYANDLRVGFLNKKMLEKAGVTTIPSTWEEMEKVMDQLKAKGVVKYPLQFPLNPEEKTTTSFLTLAFTRNGIVFNNDNTLNKESVLDALQTIERQLKKGYIDPMTPSTPGMDVFKGIINGKGAFLVGPTFFITSSNDPKESSVVGEIVTIPLPGKGKPADRTIAFTEAIGISSFSENKEAAKKFLEWMNRPEIQLRLNKEINNIPTRTSVIEKMVKEGILKENAGSLVEQSKIVASPFPNGVPKYYTRMSTEIFNIVNQLGQGKLTAEQAADLMVEKVNALAKENK